MLGPRGGARAKPDRLTWDSTGTTGRAGHRGRRLSAGGHCTDGGRCVKERLRRDSAPASACGGVSRVKAVRRRQPPRGGRRRGMGGGHSKGGASKLHVVQDLIKQVARPQPAGMEGQAHSGSGAAPSPHTCGRRTHMRCLQRMAGVPELTHRLPSAAAAPHQSAGHPPAAPAGLLPGVRPQQRHAAREGALPAGALQPGQQEGGQMGTARGQPAIVEAACGLPTHL